MPRHQPSPASRPVAWALLSQSIWLPLLAIDLHDRWQAGVRGLSPRPGDRTESPFAAGTTPAIQAGRPLTPASPGNPAPTSGILLGSAPLNPGTMATASDGTAVMATAESPGPAPSSLTLEQGRGAEALPVLGRSFSRAELLGGPITLADLQEAAIPPLALAEQGRQSLSGDPMASLPEPWREPMRQALLKLPAQTSAPLLVENARNIHIPSRRVSAATQVPLALQADGSVDILSRPREAAVVDDIREWSAGQRPPAVGSVAPAIVHLHPVAAAETLKPTAAELSAPSPAAASLPPTASADPAPVPPDPATTASPAASAEPAPPEPAAP